MLPMTPLQHSFKKCVELHHKQCFFMIGWALIEVGRLFEDFTVVLSNFQNVSAEVARKARENSAKQR